MKSFVLNSMFHTDILNKFQSKHIQEDLAVNRIFIEWMFLLFVTVQTTFNVWFTWPHTVANRFPDHFYFHNGSGSLTEKA